MTVTNPPTPAALSLGYVEKTDGDITGIGAEADLTGMTITFTTDGRPFEVWFDGVFRISASTGLASLSLYEGASLRDQKLSPLGVANQTSPVSSRKVFNYVAGTYTFKLRAGAVVAGTTTVFANTSNVLKLGANYR